jgi:TfoX/Sxy family transcriptional regulator of competence genes
MASDESFIHFVLEQVQGLAGVRYKKMFGEYALYLEEKVVALVCDNQLFIKPTPQGRKFIGEAIEAPAYPGAKPSFLIEDLEDSAWLTQLIQITAKALPVPKVKKPSTKKPKTE